MSRQVAAAAELVTEGSRGGQNASFRQQSTSHVRRNPSQSSLHSKRPLPKVCTSLPDPRSSSALQLHCEEDPFSHFTAVEEQTRPQKREPFETWLAAKEKASENARLQAKQQAEEAKRLEEDRERRKREVLQQWTERCEERIREQKINAAHLQHLKRIQQEAERLKAQQREALCREEFQRWAKSKASEQKSKVKHVSHRKGRARPALTITISSPASEPRLSLSTFQVCALPPKTLGRPKRA